jgi:DNA-binding transcriptional regulator YiaG
MSKPPTTETGATIRAWRQALGLSQESLAIALGNTVATINHWERRGVNPSRLALRRMRALGKERGVPCPL